MRHFNQNSTRFVIAFFVLFAMASASFGQKLAVSVTKSSPVATAINSSVQPILFQGPGESGNPDCADLNALYVNGSGDIRFSHIITDNELKLDFGTPSGTFPYTTGNGRFVVGPQSPDDSVTVQSSGSTVSMWSSTIQVTAVILKVGSDAYVYPYKPFSNGDTNLVTGDNRSISHLTFCFGDPSNPTAADVSLSGRVIDASGNGISKAQVVLVNGATGETKITMTSPFGYYTFLDLEVNELYVVNVNSKRHTFQEKQKTVVLLDNATDVQFVALPQQ